MEDEPSDYSVRIRFRIPGRRSLGVESNEMEVCLPDLHPVKLISADKEPDKSIKQAKWLVLKSWGFTSVEEAKTCAETLLDVLRCSLARLNLGADLGRRPPKGRFFAAFLENLSKEAGCPVINDVHGVMIFKSLPAPVFARAPEFIAHVSTAGDKWRETITEVLALQPHLSDRERVAFDLFSEAHDITESAEARFVLLFAAIEALLIASDRPKDSQQLIEEMRELAKASSISPDEKDSILGSLGWLQKQSIQRNGCQFVQSHLHGRDYQGLSPAELFLKCYDMRNRLLHGRQPFPEWKEVTNIVGDLEQMVSHLLSGLPSHEL